MTIVKTNVHLNRRIRQLNRRIKNAKNEALAYRNEATYEQAVIDNIKGQFGLTDNDIEHLNEHDRQTIEV